MQILRDVMGENLIYYKVDQISWSEPAAYEIERDKWDLYNNTLIVSQSSQNKYCLNQRDKHVH